MKDCIIWQICRWKIYPPVPNNSPPRLLIFGFFVGVSRSYLDPSKHVWLIVRHSPMKAGWWDAPPALRDLAKAIPIFSDNGLPLLTENWRASVHKTESSFANTFPCFPKTISFFMFFSEQFFSRLDSFYWMIAFPCFTRLLPLTVIYCTIKAVLHVNSYQRHFQ